MAGTQPVGLYTLKVPPGNILVPGCPDAAAMFRVSMAAIDPTAEAEREDVDDTSKPRATLKIVRFPYADSDLEDFDDDEDMEDSELLDGLDSDEDSSDEGINGGPSARKLVNGKTSKTKQILDKDDEDMEDPEDEDEDDEDDDEEQAKAILKKLMKGKAKADGADDSDDDEVDLDDDDELEIDETVVCTLDPEQHYQQTLDINVSEGERVFFKVTGTHTIHLTGNYIIPIDDGRAALLDDEDDMEEDEYDLSPDDDEELDEEDLAELNALENGDDESDILDDLPDPSRVTELDTDEEPQLTTVTKPAAKGKNKRPAEDSLLGDDAEALDDMIAEAQAAEAKKTDTASPVDEKPKKLSKSERKKLKKLKNNEGEAAPAPVETVKDKAVEKPTVNGTSSEKKVSFAKNLEQGPTPNGTAKSSSPVTSEATQPSKKTSTSLGVRDVQGVSVDDRKVGTGKEAKSGNRVEMRYIGKLENGKIFDANKSGKPFAFKLGAGEVIKGWDIGIAGMQVGSERRIIVPPHLAYGKKAMKDIPANSKLIFDVKCLSIK